MFKILKFVLAIPAFFFFFFLFLITGGLNERYPGFEFPRITRLKK